MPAGSATSLCAKCLLQVGFETNPAAESGSGSRVYQPTFIAPTIEELAPHFPQLEILEQIGYGGMGVVYRARQKELDRIVALKILRPGVSNDSGFAERFQREARALAKLNHPNIITIYDFGRVDGLFFFIMEYVDGTNLRHMERAGQLMPHEALSIVPQVCSALQYAHDNGVVHRDIKPENILISKTGELQIVDFGLAKIAGVTENEPLTGTWQVMGTPHYMAPEQFEKPNTVDHRADIYSLGVVIYELLTGELPLGRFLLPSEKVRVDVRLDEVVLRSLAKEPERRYQRVTDVATAVDDAASPADKSLSNLNDGNVMRRLRQLGEVCRTGAGSGVTQILKRKNTIGKGLMICGVVEFLSAFLPFIIGNLSLAILSCFCGLMAIVLGASLRKEYHSSRLWIPLIACMVPYTSFTLGLLFRIPLAICAVPILLSAKVGSDIGLRGYSSILDGLPEVARAIRRACSFRSVVFTFIGLGGWIAIFLGMYATVDAVWAQRFFPTTTVVIDGTVSDIRPLSDAYQRLDISASNVWTTYGLHFDYIHLFHDNLFLSILGPESCQATLEVDLSSFSFTIEGGKSDIEKRRSLQRGDVAEWMNRADVDSSRPEAQREIDNLFDLIQFMRETGGNAASLSRNPTNEFPTLRAAVMDLMKNRRRLSGDLIPVSTLLNRDLFAVSSVITKPTIAIKRREWPSIIYSVLFASIFLQGLLRVGRVLYKQLWFPLMTDTAHVDVVSEAALVRDQWKRCRRVLAASACVSALMVIMGYVGSLYAWNESVAAFSPFTRAFPDITGEIVVGALIGIAMLTTFLALLALPVLRSTGFRFGMVSSALAVLMLPLSLVTFPNGLSAWIRLTEPATRQIFTADVDKN